MYILNLDPHTAGIVACPYCNQKDPLLWNSSSEVKNFQFDSDHSLFSRDCDKCAKRYYWSPSAVRMIDSP